MMQPEIDTEELYVNENIDKDSKGGNLSLSPHLPYEIIIYDILTRVPLESLIRFRCVCKHWYDLVISDTLFTDSLRRYNNNNHNYSSPAFICHRPNKHEEFDNHRLVFIDINKHKERVIPYGPKEIKDFQGYMRIKILHSFNGLLVMSCKDKSSWPRIIDIRVYNPVTRCSKILPELPVEVIFQQECRYGLAYDSTIAKYKVVCCGRGCQVEFFCKIITLGVAGMDSWRDVVIPKDESGHYFHPHLSRPVFANGSLHWMAHTYIFNSEGMYTALGSELVLSVDVTSETLYTINLPNGCSSSLGGEGGYSSLLEMGGLLCLVDRKFSSNQLKLWVLEGEKKDNYHENYKWRVENCGIDMGHLEEEEDDEEEEEQEDADYEEEDGHGKRYLDPVAILTHPERKIIFWKLFKVLEEDHHGDIEDCVVKYYSYDMELKKLEFIYEGDEMDPCYWNMSIASPT